MPYCHLTERERYVISHLYGTHCSAREIGRRLGRSHTTICREVVRNKSEHMRYWYTYTHPKALARRKVARHLKRQTNRKLMRYVERRLRRKWSPEQIANRLLLDYPNDELMRISVEGLYRIIYQRSANGCHLYRQLRRGRKRRRRQVGYGARGSRIVDRVSISERPECVDNRQRYGDWEGDTVVGKRGSGAIVTHVERKSLYFMASKLTEKKAIELTDKSIQLYKKVKPPLRKTLTIDNVLRHESNISVARQISSHCQRQCVSVQDSLPSVLPPLDGSFSTIVNTRSA